MPPAHITHDTLISVCVAGRAPQTLPGPRAWAERALSTPVRRAGVAARLTCTFLRDGLTVSRHRSQGAGWHEARSEGPGLRSWAPTAKLRARYSPRVCRVAGPGDRDGWNTSLLPGALTVRGGAGVTWSATSHLRKEGPPVRTLWEGGWRLRLLPGPRDVFAVELMPSELCLDG